MITRDTDIDSINAIRIITICCEEVIEQQIIPELNLIYSIKVSNYDDFLKYIYLIESIIKSAAIVQQLRQIQINLQVDVLSKHLMQEIFILKDNNNLNIKYNNIFDLYYHDQPKINIFLTTSASLFSHRTYIADLQYIIRLATKGMLYTTDIAQYKLPATYYCYTKNFNVQLSTFLKCIINDTYDEYNKQLYTKYTNLPISEEAFSSVITSLAFRLHLALEFIHSYYAAQELIEEHNTQESSPSYDTFFLNFVGKVRSESLSN